ncbi:hypothetical protein ACFPU1_16915 [Thalassorhabdus alkalitolerans]|uniref:Uncharacterized protein n=1 Tax=Thalassorhabdus alkalitolerans TaxID=2282697 RepID=A0ABW0YTB8_9BACI
MSSYNKDEFVVPPSIELIFDNNQLELMNTLCLFYVFFQKKPKKFYKIPDIIFYYSIVNFNLLNVIEAEEDVGFVSRNLYFRYQQNINQLLLELYNLQFVDIKGKVSFKTDQLGARLTTKGNEFVNSLEIEYFVELINKYLEVIEMVDNNTENKNKIKGGKK